MFLISCNSMLLFDGISKHRLDGISNELNDAISKLLIDGITKLQPKGGGAKLKNKFKKSRIWETKNFSTDADSRNNTRDCRDNV